SPGGGRGRTPRHVCSGRGAGIRLAALGAFSDKRRAFSPTTGSAREGFRPGDEPAVVTLSSCFQLGWIGSADEDRGGCAKADSKYAEHERAKPEPQEKVDEDRRPCHRRGLARSNPERAGFDHDLTFAAQRS